MLKNIFLNNVKHIVNLHLNAIIITIKLLILQ